LVRGRGKRAFGLEEKRNPGRQKRKGEEKGRLTRTPPITTRPQPCKKKKREKKKKEIPPALTFGFWGEGKGVTCFLSSLGGGWKKRGSACSFIEKGGKNTEIVRIKRALST